MIIIGTDNANMEGFEKTGWKLLPFNPHIPLFIANEIHVELLDESLEIYGHIWGRLAKE